MSEYELSQFPDISKSLIFSSPVSAMLIRTLNLKFGQLERIFLGVGFRIKREATVRPTRGQKKNGSGYSTVLTGDCAQPSCCRRRRSGPGNADPGGRTGTACAPGAPVEGAGSTAPTPATGFPAESVVSLRNSDPGDGEHHCLFRPSATKSNRPYGFMSASSLSLLLVWRTPHPLAGYPPPT